MTQAEMLFDGDASARAAVTRTLHTFGFAALRFAVVSGIRVIALTPSQRYDVASAALRRLRVDVDSWPSPPAGLFVVEERAVYLLSRSPMTIAHEFGHALDCALGGGVYYSGISPDLRRLFSNARAFVTPYAASGIDEYFAEALRAYVEVNDPASAWPRATRERLRRVDPQLYAFVSDLFTRRFLEAVA